MTTNRLTVSLAAVALTPFAPRALGQEHAAAPAAQAPTSSADIVPGPQTIGAGFAARSRARSGPAMPRMPLTFVANEGQWDSPALFVAQNGALTLGIERDGIAICTRGGDEAGDVLTSVHLAFEGARGDAVVEGSERALGQRNFYLGNDPARWRTDVAAYGRVLYRSLYDGIDLQLRESEGLPEYDFVLAPGADLGQIRVRCDGVESLCIDADGKLQLDTAAGPLHQSPPTTWYETASGERRLVECKFELVGERAYGFRIDGRDESLPLVVDPGLTWSTFYGGSGDDSSTCSCIDPSGRVVFAGVTSSVNLPGASGSLGGGYDAFVAVLDPSQAGPLQLVWASYVGGTGTDVLYSITTDAVGTLYASGGSNSANFPTTPGAYDTSVNTFLDAVVLEFGPTGGIAYSSFFGGAQVDWSVDIEVSAPHLVTLYGVTYSLAASFPITPGAFQPAYGGSGDYFVARLALNGAGASDLVYSTYLGGAAREGMGYNPALDNMDWDSMVLDAGGDVVLSGMTVSSIFPVTANAYQPTKMSGQDAVVARLRPQGNGAADLVYSTFLGGSAEDRGLAIAVDAAGLISVGGRTYSSDFPTTAGSFNPNFVGPAGRSDAFLARLDPSQPPSAQLVYSTYIGGDLDDGLYSLASDGTGGLVCNGWVWDTSSSTSTFPTTCNAVQSTFGGYQDIFLLHLDPSGNGPADLTYSTLLGGAGWDFAGNVCVVGSGSALRVIATGATRSTTWPTVNAFQPTFGGGTWDALVFEILIPPAPGPYCTAGTTTNGCVASIAGTGNASASLGSGFTISVSNVEGAQSGAIIYGLSGQVANPWGAGSSFMCVKSPFERMTALNSGGTPGACDGVLSIDWNQYIATHTGALGYPFVGGETVFAQGWFRDPPAPKTTNLSDALTFVVCP